VKIDIRPNCIVCGKPWMPPEGVNAQSTACGACTTSAAPVGVTLSAEALFDAHRKEVVLECDFYDQLVAKLADWEAPDDVGYDYYDDSFEMCGCHVELRLTESVLAWLWSLGFKRGWLNHFDGTETYYYVGGSVEGTHQKVEHPRRNDGEKY
jgi:hypothetical protein